VRRRKGNAAVAAPPASTPSREGHFQDGM